MSDPKVTDIKIPISLPDFIFDLELSAKVLAAKRDYGHAGLLRQSADVIRMLTEPKEEAKETEAGKQAAGFPVDRT